MTTHRKRGIWEVVHWIMLFVQRARLAGGQVKPDLFWIIVRPCMPVPTLHKREE